MPARTTAACTLPFLLAMAAGCGEAPAPDAGVPGGAAPASAMLDTLRARTELTLEAAEMWKPLAGEDLELDPYLAPLLYREVDGGGAEPAIGALVPGPHDEPLLDLERPTLYFDDVEVQIAGAEHRRLSFVWFHEAGPGSPPIPQGLRTTFGADGSPAFTEVLVDTSGARVLYVARALEDGAAERLGAALPGREHVVEPDLARQPLLVVARVVADGPMPMGPFAYQSAGSSDIVSVHCRCEPSQVGEVRATREYELAPLAELERLDIAPAWPAEEAAELLRLPERF